MTILNPNAAAYADKVRLRVSGICIQDDKLLLVRHQATIANNCFWAPPGGGLQFGETVEACLQREFFEETGLQVAVKRFLFLNEFLQPPLHAIELFFEVQILGGQAATGYDPESPADQQLIEEVAFLPMSEIRKIPQPDKHKILHYLINLDDLFGMTHQFAR
ncbi:NUDIX hydrolase [Pontibacter sp. SGAir0037]|uniref:NUDIX domain-containing protein n=1 Tax=Pontibacter sp. SGAir0037 TaxID=2571030 RepID=UPI0010CD44C5|nr:NUDIX hydrolase [Pontibacter sp. SGAir0037]QCR21731.1 NUDIX hydrolase [Pontibacter sp. SGAir0037]